MGGGFVKRFFLIANSFAKVICLFPGGPGAHPESASWPAGAKIEQQIKDNEKK